MSPLRLGDGHLVLMVPPGIRVQREKANFETVEYDVYEATGALPLLQVVDGGAAYDLRLFTKSCLNARPAWTAASGGARTVVVGEPGSWAVAVYWSDLSGERLNEAKAIVSSIQIDFGNKCSFKGAK